MKSADRAAIEPLRGSPSNLDLKFLPASPSQGPFLISFSTVPKKACVSYAESLPRQFSSIGATRRTIMPPSFTSTKMGSPFHGRSSTIGHAITETPRPRDLCSDGLEAWAHKRVEEGDPIEAVVAQIVGDPAMSSAALWLQVDVVLSHRHKGSTRYPRSWLPRAIGMDRLRPLTITWRFQTSLG